MILIHAADLHLGSPLGGLDGRDLPAARIRQAPMRAFEHIADLCEARGAGLLVLAGDLFDGDADLPTMYEAMGIIQRITAAGTKVVSLRGNHDAVAKMQLRMPAIDGFRELPSDAPGTFVYDELGVAVHGRGFDTQHVNDSIVTSYPAAVPDVLNVGVLHTSLTGSVAGHKQYAPCTVDDLVARGYQYWALGHVHKRQVHAEDPWIIFPGNPQGRDVGEAGPRGVTVVEYADGHVVGTPEHVVLDGVRWHVIEVALVADEPAEELTQRIGATLAELVAEAPGIAHVARVRIGGRGVAHAELDSAPDAFRAQLHEIVMGISVDDLYLERVVLDTLPALPDADELRAREDFIGEAARALLDDPDGLDDPPPLPEPDAMFAVLDRKLSQLQADALGDVVEWRDDLDDVAALATAREALVGRMLIAHAEDAEAAR